MNRSATAEIGICRDCGSAVEQRGRDVWRCRSCGEEWDLQTHHDYWRFSAEVDERTPKADDWEVPEGHAHPPRAEPDIGFIAAAGLMAGGAFGVVLAALTSPVAAVLLVGAMVALAAGSVRLFREVMA